MTVELKLSREIYSRLIGGKVVNRYELNGEGERIENALYSEIANNFDDYNRQYLMAGQTLVQGLNFFFLRNDEDDGMKLDITKKITTLLILIGHHNAKKFSHDKLSSERGGLTTAEIEDMAEDEIVVEALMRAEVKNGLLNGIKTILVDRGIMWAKPNGSFILSDAGNAFFADLQKE